MSLARTALRLAAVEALCPNALAETGPWPTIAGPLVYDSRVDLLQEGADLSTIESKPILIVYTEEDTTTPYGQAQYPAEEQVVHLVVEAMIAAKAEVEVDLGNGQTQTVGFLTAAPITTLQQELLIDLLEDQVRVALDPQKRSVASGELFRSVAMELRRIESVPQRAEDRITRLNARTVKLLIKVNKGKRAQIPTTPAPTDLDLLPEPLRTVAKALPATSPGYQACLSILAMLRQPTPLTPLQQIGIVTAVDGSPNVVASVVLGHDATVPVAPSDSTQPAS